MKVLIAGGGTMGREIAKAIPEHEIIVIDRDPEVCQRLNDELDATVVLGSASRLHVLEKAGIADVGLVIAVTPKDSKNLLLSLYAKKLGKKVVARVREPTFLDIFQQAGVEHIISPEQRAAMDIAKQLTW